MARTSWLTLALVAGTLAPSTALAAERPPLALRHIWVYTHPNLAREPGLAKTVAMVERAARGGYTGIVLVENRMQRWSQVDAKYLANLGTFRQACRDQKLECVAAVTPLGYANDLLSNEPDLAAGIVGVMYTTWSNDFRNLEKYAQAARAFERDYKAAAGKAESR